MKMINADSHERDPPNVDGRGHDVELQCVQPIAEARKPRCHLLAPDAALVGR
jgi:hypothetical protein